MNRNDRMNIYELAENQPQRIYHCRMCGRLIYDDGNAVNPFPVEPDNTPQVRIEEWEGGNCNHDCD